MWTLLTLACGSPAPAPTAPPTPAPAPAAPVPAAPAPPAGFVCCADSGSQAVVDAYLPLQRSLVESNVAAAAAAARTLATAAQSAGAPEVAALAQAVAGTELEPLRDAFAPLSAGVIAYARAHTGGALVVREAWCPMAPGGWLQTEAAIRNPYYGDQMLTCGSFR